MFVFMTLDYPAPENVQALAQGMSQMRGWMESQPGCSGAEPLRPRQPFFLTAVSTGATA